MAPPLPVRTFRFLPLALALLACHAAGACARLEDLQAGDGTTSVGTGDAETTPDTTGGGKGAGTGTGTGTTPLPDTVHAAHAQSSIAYMAGWPSIPGCNGCSGWSVRDWRESSRRYHQLLFDDTQTGTYLPLSAFRATAGAERINMPSYLNQSLDPNGNGGEALGVLGGLLGATLLGNVDMRNFNGLNWMKAVPYYSAKPDATRFVTNNVGQVTASTAWYSLFPSILSAHLASLYRDDADLGLTALTLENATTWASALNVLVDNWDHTGFNFTPGQRGTVDAGWREPDMGIGIAYVAEMAYEASGGARDDLNQASATALNSMDRRVSNPFYEVLGFYGPLVAARRNALRGEAHDVGHYVDWVFSPNSSARNWGMVSQRWGSYDAYGLYGEINNNSTQLGYAFSMNTFTAAAALAPTVRYVPSYAKAIGKYLLHVAVNGQAFFPDSVASARQDAHAAYSDLRTRLGYNPTISYEALRGKPNAESLSTGDQAAPVVNLNPYGAWAQGYMQALVTRTNDANTLRIDLLATDPWHPPAHPTFLYYNPNPAAVTVDVPVVGDAAVDFVDVVSGKTLARNVTTQGSLQLAADQAVVLVMPPTAQPVTVAGNVTSIGGIAVDWGL